MAVYLAPIAGVAAQFFDNNGNPLSGGKLYTYQAGTTTPAVTYTTNAGVNLHTNPIILDSGGRIPNGGEVWLSDNISYKLILKTSDDVTVATWDNIDGINSNFLTYSLQQEIQTATDGQTVFNLSTITYQPATGTLSVYVDGLNQYGPSATYSYVETDSSTVTFNDGLHEGALVKFTTTISNTGNSINASAVTYDPYVTGAVTTNVQTKLRETVSVKDFGAVGNGLDDDTTAINNALATGNSVYFPDGTYIVTALTLSSSGVTLSGNGILKKKAGVDAKLFTISGSNNEVIGLRFDGTNLQPTSNYLNDIITISGNNNLIENCFINGSKGGGITIGNASGNRILNNVIKNVYDNGILVAGAGADVNIISGNWLDGTTHQNNIFITASADSTPNGQYVYGNIVTNNYCANAGDTGIESGYHAQRTVIANNITTTSYNPGILVRDGFSVNITGNIVINAAYASQPSTYDGIAVVPQNESASYNYSTRISDNTVLGAVKRSSIFVGGSYVDILDNYLYDNNTTIGSNGSGLVGGGVVLASALTDINVRGNTIYNFSTGVNFNYDNVAKTMTNIHVQNNNIKNTAKAVDGYYITFASCNISNNIIKTVTTAAFNLTNATVNGQAKYMYNDVDLTGFTSVTPVNINSDTYSRVLCLIMDANTQVFTVPENQYDFITILTSGLQSAGTCTIQFADGTQIATFAVGGPATAGTGTTSKLIGTTGLLDSTGSGGFANWSLFYDASNNLILQRRGANTGSSARYLKVIVRDAG